MCWSQLGQGTHPAPGMGLSSPVAQVAGSTEIDSPVEAVLLTAKCNAGPTWHQHWVPTPLPAAAATTAITCWGCAPWGQCEGVSTPTHIHMLLS